MVTVRAFLAVAMSKNWELHVDLKEKVYMKFPPGFESSDPDLVCRLRKSLYGLIHSSRCWFAKLATALKEDGFKQSYFDYSLLLTFVVPYNSTSLCMSYIFSSRVTNFSTLSISKAYLSQCFNM